MIQLCSMISTSYSTVMNRLKRVQELLCHDVQPVQPLKPRNKVSEKADAIVCITGIDSRNSIGADELFNFLFPNLRKEELQLDREAQGQYDWDDVVIVVKSNSVAVYCNPVNLKQLFPYFAQWENLTVHCLTEYQYEDQDLAEEYKISSFVAMLKGCKSVGVPYHVSGHSSSCHDICIEKWPLIQASALEEFGSGGFFTMVHDVVDVAPLLSTVYEHLDSITLRKIISTELTQFTHQWHMMCSTVGIAIDKFAGDTVDVSVGKILEPLTTYYSLGKMGNGNVEGLKKPFVLCGQNTNRAAFTAGSLHSHSEQRQVVAPLHMVVQSVSPCAPLSCARTYFLAPTFTPCQGEKLVNSGCHNLTVV
ncbi:PREDICTED: uncharacterized protein C20orf194-like [Priapulus caudatus]|uniref:Uncharacterized protein C20orf194-like n=1 Tax=Priapulus caudatus TaxID=37621 RepID=A0ABM1EEJ8_PRICU|nr:PREDICTED: uncharacterized protein C20orf194-like [Priapulus caudatus]